MLNRSERDFLEYNAFQLLDQIVAFTVSTVLYGIFIPLFLLLMSTFIQQDVKSRSTWSLFAITFITLLLSTLHWTVFLADIVITIQRTLLHAREIHGSFGGKIPDFPFNIIFLEVSVPRVLQIFGDIIVIWRAWVLSDHQSLFIAAPMVLLIATCGASSGFLYLYFVDFDDVGYHYLVNHLFVASGALSAATNATSTLVTAWRYFKYRRLLRSTKGGFRSRGLSILLLLIESGCVYCVLQVTNILLSGDGLSSTTYNDAYNYATMFFAGAFIQATAMYPTIVVVLIQHRRSVSDSTQNAARAEGHDNSSNSV